MVEILLTEDLRLLGVSVVNRTLFRQVVDHVGSFSLMRVRQKRVKRSAYAYEALNIQGTIVCSECHSSVADSAYGALLEAMVDAAMQARRCGFSQLLFMRSSKRLVYQFSRTSIPNWMEKTTFADLSTLKQLGIGFKYLFVPTVVLNSVYSVAVLATKSPMHYNWAMPPSV
ncbi:hypothetical protein SO802_029385 [Lithocarpus litseifolius]|uniref:RNase H type-1 domain-containing protein n=1 Tax=Lithocarpus litseifolius TaxID=425828 RepID=A0AAW2BT48_9ROSI